MLPLPSSFRPLERTDEPSGNLVTRIYDITCNLFHLLSPTDPGQLAPTLGISKLQCPQCRRQQHCALLLALRLCMYCLIAFARDGARIRYRFQRHDGKRGCVEEERACLKFIRVASTNANKLYAHSGPVFPASNALVLLI